MRIFLDSSALTKRYVEEAGSDVVLAQWFAPALPFATRKQSGPSRLQQAPEHLVDVSAYAEMEYLDDAR